MLFYDFVELLLSRFYVDMLKMKQQLSRMFLLPVKKVYLSTFSVLKRKKKIPKNSQLPGNPVPPYHQSPHFACACTELARAKEMIIMDFLGRKCFSCFQKDPSPLFSDWLIESFCRAGLNINTALCSSPLRQKEEFKQRATTTTQGKMFTLGKTLLRRGK